MCPQAPSIGTSWMGNPTFTHSSISPSSITSSSSPCTMDSSSAWQPCRGQVTTHENQAGSAIPLNAWHQWLYLVPKDDPTSVGVGASSMSGLSLLKRLIAVIVIELSGVQPCGCLCAGGAWELHTCAHSPSQPGIHIQPRCTQQCQSCLCLCPANLRMEGCFSDYGDAYGVADSYGVGDSPASPLPTQTQSPGWLLHSTASQHNCTPRRL